MVFGRRSFTCFLKIERQDDQWSLGVFDRERQWWMYRAQSTEC
jgi:hypothetical protein